MQHLEIVTHHAIETGAKEDVASGFSASLITPGFLVAALSQRGLVAGVSELVLSLIERDHDAVRATNMILLKNSGELCPRVDHHCFRRLLGIIKSHIGLGKGTLYSTVKHMPEQFAVVQLGLWQREGALQRLDTQHLESLLNHALAERRFHVAHGLCKLMASRGDHLDLHVTLSGFPYSLIEEASLSAYLSRTAAVELLCGRKAFHQAKVTAGDDPSLDQVVRDSIGKHLKLRSPSKNWVDLFSALAIQLDEVIDPQQLINRHKSAALVVLNQITTLDAETLKNQVNTDKVRLLAFQLGVRDLIGSVTSSSARDRALATDLGL